MEFSARLLLSSSSGYSRNRVRFLQSVSVLASLAEWAGRQCNGLRCLDPATNILEKRLAFLDAEYGALQ